VEAELGGDHDLTAKRLQRFAHQLLVGEGTVNLRCVEEGDAPLNRRVKKRDHLLLVANRAVAVAHAHAAETERRDFQITFTECAFLHFEFLHSRSLQVYGALPPLEEKSNRFATMRGVLSTWSSL